MHYDITYHDKSVGKALVRKTGLYWDVSCECKIDSTDFLNVYAEDEKSKMCLGILVPEDNGLQVRKAVPCRKIDLEHVRFYVELKHPKSNIPFIPIYPDEPFRYLDKLKSSHLEWNREGKTVRGIYLDPNQQDSGPSPGSQDK